MTREIRPIDKKRINQMIDLTESLPESDDIWFIHTVLAQCFLPYRDPKTRDWDRSNGEFSISLTAGRIKNPTTGKFEVVGLPYGAKPRLFQSYICTQVIKQQSPVIAVEHSMTGMMKELGLGVSGGKQGTIGRFKEQIIRFATCNFQIVGPGPRGGQRYVNAPPIKRFDVWFPPDPNQKTLWPSEIVLTDDYFYSLKDHAIPFDFRAMKAIQNKPRAQDIYLWMTQRLCRIRGKTLMMTWESLFEMFGGSSEMKEFKRSFRKDLLAACTSYPSALLEELKDGYLFKVSRPPIERTRFFVQKSVD